MRVLPVAALVLLVFGGFSVNVILQQGVLGFLDVARREPWGMQLLIDLAISLFLASLWLKPDAERRGLSPWPWLIGSVFVGSLSPLAYVVYRELVGKKAAEQAAVGSA